jgi:hypothetical protein
MQHQYFTILISLLPCNLIVAQNESKTPYINPYTKYVALSGAHPFEPNEFRIREEEYHVTGYKFKLNNQFDWANKRKIRASCDGICIYD